MTAALSSLTQLWEQAILPSLASKSVWLYSTLLGSSNFLIADILTDNKSYAGVIAGLSVMATAYFTSRPRVIAAQAAREATRHVNLENSKDTLIADLRHLHRDEIKGYKRELEDRDLKTELVRLSKHAAIDLFDKTQWHIFRLQQHCRDAGVEPLPYERVDISQIFTGEDKELKKYIAELVRRRAEETQQ